MPPRVTALMVTYNSAAPVVRSLASLAECHARGLCEAVVVDNASSDGTVAYLRANHGWARLIEADSNLGFGRGNNRGIPHVHTPYTLLLNPDAAIRPAVLEEMVRFLDAEPRVGLVGPAIQEAGKQPQPVFRFPTPVTVLAAAIGRLGRSRWLAAATEPRRYRVDWLCGAVLLARTELLRQIGGFDPRFFLYFEETDLCRRALAAGSECWVLGDLAAGHSGGSSARTAARPMWEGCIAEHFFRSRYYYLAKHHGWLRATLTEILELGLVTVVGGGRWLLRRPTYGLVGTRWRSPILRMPPAVDEPLAPEVDDAALAAPPGRR